MDFIQFYEMFFSWQTYMLCKNRAVRFRLFFWYDAGTSAVGTYYERVVKKCLTAGILL